MKKEEKQLLIQDLCARLPHNLQGVTSEGIVSPLLTKGEADWDIITSLNYRIVKHGWRPYLRSMSSLTEEEKNEHFGRTMTIDIVRTSKEVIDWLNAHHFDYRGLIPIGLALEAPKDMYNIKTE